MCSDCDVCVTQAASFVTQIYNQQFAGTSNLAGLSQAVLQFCLGMSGLTYTQCSAAAQLVFVDTQFAARPAAMCR